MRGVDGLVGLGQSLFGLPDGLALALQLGAGPLGPLAVGPLPLGRPLLPVGPAGSPRRAAGLGQFRKIGTEAEPGGLHRLDQLGGGHVGGHPRVGQGRPQGAGHLLLQRVRRVGHPGTVQGLPGQLGQQLPAGPRQLPQPAAVQCALGRAKLVTEPGEPVHRRRVGAGQPVDHPGGPGGTAQRADGPGRSLVPGRAGLRHQVAAAVGEPGRIGGVQLVGGRPHPFIVGHTVIVPRPGQNMITPNRDHFFAAREGTKRTRDSK